MGQTNGWISNKKKKKLDTRCHQFKMPKHVRIKGDNPTYLRHWASRLDMEAGARQHIRSFTPTSSSSRKMSADRRSCECRTQPYKDGYGCRLYVTRLEVRTFSKPASCGVVYTGLLCTATAFFISLPPTIY